MGMRRIDTASPPGGISLLAGEAGAPSGVVEHGPPDDRGWRAWLRAMLRRSFARWVGVPVIIFGIYILLFAPAIFQSEAQIVVRSANLGSSSILMNFGMSRSSDETEIVDAYIQSPEIVRDLLKRIDLAAIYSRPEGGVIFSLRKPFLQINSEVLYKHFKRWTVTDVDHATGVLTVRAYAFRPEDAKRVADETLDLAEQLVNRLNQRAYLDRVAYAEAILAKAKNELAAVEGRLTQFRNETRTVDLGREATSALEMVGRMTAELAAMEANYRHQLAVAPNSPALASEKTRIESFRKEIEEIKRKIVGSNSSLSVDLGKYERLMLERGLAARMLESASVNLDRIRQQAEVQQFYLVRISEPVLPETAEYPRRWLWLMVATAGLTLLWGAGRALLDYIREHNQ